MIALDPQDVKNIPAFHIPNRFLKAASLEARKQYYRFKLLGSHANREVKYDITEDLIGLFALDLHTTVSSGLSASAASASAATMLNVCHSCGKPGNIIRHCPLKCSKRNLRCCPGRDRGAHCVVKAAAVPLADIKMASGGPITRIALVILKEQHAKLHNLPIKPRPPELFKDSATAPHHFCARASEYYPENNLGHDDEDNAYNVDETDYLNRFSASAALHNPHQDGDAGEAHDTYTCNTWSPSMSCANASST